MSASATSKICIGDWCVDPEAGQISRGTEVVRVEARTMRLLLDLARHRGEVVSIDELLDRVWPGVTVSSDSVYQAVASLRRLLQDDPKQPRYIATVPRSGYRMIAAVGPWPDLRSAQQPRQVSSRTIGALVAGAIAAAALVGSLVWFSPLLRAGRTARAIPARPATVGVAPFVDLTPTMDQEELADEMTEGLADKLGRQSHLRTPGFRSSYYLIGKKNSVAQAGRQLGVAYVVDGSVRRTGDRVRIAARLVRPDTGLVMWSQTYEGRLQEMPTFQGAISSAVANAIDTPGASGRGGGPAPNPAGS